jgi:hypothetical protein
MAFLPVSTTCYSDRVAELRRQLGLLERQRLQGGISEELEDLFNREIRRLYAFLWAIHAELEEE